jgi:hypothetical protein
MERDRADAGDLEKGRRLGSKSAIRIIGIMEPKPVSRFSGPNAALTASRAQG